MTCERCGGPVNVFQLKTGKQVRQTICNTCWIPGTPDPEQAALDEHSAGEQRRLTKQCGCVVHYFGYDVVQIEKCRKHAKPAHTPTPWNVIGGNIGEGSAIIAHNEHHEHVKVVLKIRAEDATFIVQAVNTHDAYVKLARDIVEAKTDHSVLVHAARLLLAEEKTSPQ